MNTFGCNAFNRPFAPPGATHVISWHSRCNAPVAL
jgi:hypothetical protein